MTPYSLSHCGYRKWRPVGPNGTYPCGHCSGIGGCQAEHMIARQTISGYNKPSSREYLPPSPPTPALGDDLHTLLKGTGSTNRPRATSGAGVDITSKAHVVPDSKRVGRGERTRARALASERGACGSPALVPRRADRGTLAAVQRVRAAGEVNGSYQPRGPAIDGRTGPAVRPLPAAAALRRGGPGVPRGTRGIAATHVRRVGAAVERHVVSAWAS